MKRWGCGQLAIGCTGLLVGVSVTIGVEVYLASQAAKKVSEKYKEWELQAKMESLCASEAGKNDAALKETCEQVWEQKKRNAEAASKSAEPE